VVKLRTASQVLAKSITTIRTYPAGFCLAVFLSKNSTNPLVNAVITSGKINNHLYHIYTTVLLLSNIMFYSLLTIPDVFPDVQQLAAPQTIASRF